MLGGATSRKIQDDAGDNPHLRRSSGTGTFTGEELSYELAITRIYLTVCDQHVEELAGVLRLVR
ncbi:MAG: hypothetical protein O7J95_17310, partial [Planctomycetota bacterium]|nr:hypothetical protein [Planctomycetota bacterium]